MKKPNQFVTLVLAASVWCFVPGFADDEDEVEQLDVDIEFFNAVGHVIAGPQGLTFHFQGTVFTQPNFYPPEFWGEYPLYLPGGNVDFKVTVANTGPAVDTTTLVEGYVINEIDGSDLESITTPQTHSAQIAQGETDELNLSFQIPSQAKLLNRIRVTLHYQHLEDPDEDDEDDEDDGDNGDNGDDDNGDDGDDDDDEDDDDDDDGDDDDDENDVFVIVKEGIFCPPDNLSD